MLFRSAIGLYPNDGEYIKNKNGIYFYISGHMFSLDCSYVWGPDYVFIHCNDGDENQTSIFDFFVKEIKSVNPDFIS